MRRITSTFLATALLALAMPHTAESGGVPTLRYDHLECFQIVRDLRDVPGAEIALTPKNLTDFAEQTGCQIGPNTRRPRAKEYCVPVAKDPNEPPRGPGLEAAYLCYNLRCDDRGTELTRLEVEDQFAAGTIILRRTRGNQRLCVPVPGNPCTGLPDGSQCDDGNPATTGELCVAEQCVDKCFGVTCTASDQCHVAGTCDPLTGTCSDPNAPDNTPCDDLDGGTIDDVCTAGVCAGVAEPLLTCPCWNTFTASSLAALMNGWIIVEPQVSRCEDGTGSSADTWLEADEDLQDNRDQFAAANDVGGGITNGPGCFFEDIGEGANGIGVILDPIAPELAAACEQELAALIPRLDFCSGG